MISFVKQRVIGWSLLILVSSLMVWFHRWYSGEMPRFSYLTGWALFGLILLLSLYNARKKLPFVPLLSSELWLQSHIYGGLLTAALFAVHISYKMPTGWFEGMLAWLYVMVMLSGFFGLFVSRAIPKRLTTRGGEVLFERIPSIRRQLQERAEALALTSLAQVQSSTVADFYARELKNFFEGSRNVGLHLLEVRSPLNRLLNKITDLNRYLNEQERTTLDQIAGLVRQKDGLDYHYALQLLLKVWLFVHIPLTYSLLLYTLAHVVLVFAFSGGAR